MSTHAELGMNRTGIATSPRLTQEMVEGTAEFPPSSDGDESAISAERGDYARRQLHGCGKQCFWGSDERSRKVDSASGVEPRIYPSNQRGDPDRRRCYRLRVG